MSFLCLVSSAVLLGAVASAKNCVNVTVPVQIDARQGQYDVPQLYSNFDATQFAYNYTKQGSNFSDIALIGFQNINGLYNISAKYCSPDASSSPSSSAPVVQVLTHGIGFDKSYWDLPYNNYNYSYIDVALANGFHTVSIDRFGIGNSSHADPLNVVQAQAEVSALYDITMKLRAGTFPEVSAAFQKVVHVGHSFGSLQTYLLSAQHPNATDGVALTGFSMNGTWVDMTIASWNLRLASLNQPLRFGNTTISRNRFSAGWFGTATVKAIAGVLSSVGIDLQPYQIFEEIATTEIANLINQYNASVAPVPQNLSSGYLTWPDLTTNIYSFLFTGYFDTGAAIFAESTKQPVTLGEIFTLPIGPKMSSFTGPALVITGAEDNIYCGGDCYATGGQGSNIPEISVAPVFPNASAFEAYIQPNTGHGINLHYNSTAAYQVIQDWFKKNGLASA
ncbi:hypothetical protein AAFC00_006293 [Neodothiora populina]|uniref:AB hydrolase-1 domain-containing protein n=1 Tax=Neodothiora populina TaxID=2781224 RepID=A0ABR3P4Z1_9PEZI